MLTLIETMKKYDVLLEKVTMEKILSKEDSAKAAKIFKDNWSLSDWYSFSKYVDGVAQFEKLKVEHNRYSCGRPWRWETVIEIFTEALDRDPDYMHIRTSLKDPTAPYNNRGLVIDLRKSILDHPKILNTLHTYGYFNSKEEAISHPKFGAKARLKVIQDAILTNKEAVMALLKEKEELQKQP